MSDKVVYSAVKFRNLHHKVDETQNAVIYSEVRICDSLPTQPASSCEQTERSGAETLSTEENAASVLCYRVAVMCLALLCAVLLIVIIVFSVSLNKVTGNFHVMEENLEQLRSSYSLLAEEKSSLQEDYKSLQENSSSIAESKDKLEKSYNILQMEADQLQDKYNKIKNKSDLCGPCPWGWQRLNSKCYYISKHGKLHWDDSKQYCSKHRAHLVIINSEEEKNFINKHIASDYWIGLYREAWMSAWTWVDNTPLGENRFWQKGQPGNLYYYSKECVISNAAGWKKESCYSHNFWVCETEALIF